MRATGCLGFCQAGPLVLLQPDGIVYQHVGVDDAAEIVEKTALGEVVERLLCIDAERHLRREEERSPSTATSSACCCATAPASTRRRSTTTSRSAATRPSRAPWRSGPRPSSTRSGDPACAAAAAPASPRAASGRRCRRAEGELKYVVCNADEGDPGAFMDDALLEGNPHSVLEGMIIGAFAMGATPGTRLRAPGVPARRGAHHARHRAGARAGPARRAHPRQRATRFDVRVSRGGGAFVCGEASAMMASLEGRRGVPRRRLIHLVRARALGAAHEPQQRRDLGQRAADRPATAPTGTAPSAPRAPRAPRSSRSSARS